MDEMRLILPPEKLANTILHLAIPFRKILDSILYVLRNGCQWKILLKEDDSGSTCHRRFRAAVDIRYMKDYRLTVQRCDWLATFSGCFDTSICIHLADALFHIRTNVYIHPCPLSSASYTNCMQNRASRFYE